MNELQDYCLPEIGTTENILTIKLLNYFKYQFKKIIRGKFSYLKKIIINKFFLLFDPSLWGIKKANYAFLIGKYAHLSRKDHKLIGYKTKLIWGQHRDYDDYLRENIKKINTKRKKALFIDQAIPYHPDRVVKLGVTFDPKEYYKSIRNFLERLNESFGYEIEISCCPKIQVHKLKKFFPKFKIEIGKTIKQIRNSSLVIAHHSNATNYAVIYKKPIIFITNNCLNNDLYYHYEEINLRAKLFNKRCINIDEKPIFDIANYLKVNKKTYNNYLTNFIKTKGQRKFQADIIFEKLKRDRVWI